MIDQKNILGVIIAGGQATRMNKENKALKMLAGRTLAEHIAARIAPQVNEIAINANRDLDKFSSIGDKVTGQSICIISDKDDLGAGPLAGLYQSLEVAKNKDYSHLATVAGDTPFFPKNLVTCLSKATATNSEITIAKSGGFPQPLFGIWPTILASNLENWLSNGNTNKVMAWVRTHTHQFVEFDNDNGIDPFFNINTPEDLTAAEIIYAKAKK